MYNGRRTLTASSTRKEKRNLPGAPKDARHGKRDKESSWTALLRVSNDRLFLGKTKDINSSTPSQEIRAD
ncbi:hypothetical protein M6B38_256875 [Iris pallida]|uniref:Uncharacterized protein n=1 Tax=Iris pallida TaxID=29817 RepID=A0AAX6IG06_IRIPA|nr:hypothetical protein M6B38_152750 [Iris pallida]KAJ6852159.1 hypothetical protein M6B38_256875 [Iris pallida]